MIGNRTMLSALTVGFTAFSAMFADARAVAAQGAATMGGRSNTQGMVVGAHVGGTSLAFDGAKSETGGGGGVLVGYGFNQQFMLYVGFDVAKVKVNYTTDAATSNSTLTNVDLGVRYSFANPARALVPYLDAAITGRRVSATALSVDRSTSGPAFTGGAGVQYFVNSKVAVDANFQYTTGKFTKTKIGGVSQDVTNASSSNSSRLNVGVRFYPNIGTSLHR
ncbi:MAG: porin family protein [Gemmatimonadota bacterium]|nr:porin family protein [Gemmatimonadota bacterium]